MNDITYKLTILLERSPDLEPDEFSERWLELERADPVSAPGLVRYVFDRPYSAASPIAGATAAPYDAAVETWWRRKNDAADWVVSRQFEGEWLSRRLPLLAGRPAAVAGEPKVIWERDPAATATAVKVLVLPVALRRLRFQDFVDHWTGTHATLALEGPQAKERLVRLEHTPAPLQPPARFERTRFDGVGAITFESADALTAEFGSDRYRSVLAPDEARFTDAAYSAAFVTTPVELG